MDTDSYSTYILLLLSIVTVCYCQTYPSITEPKLTSIIPLNSTALTVNWQFADSSIDQSDLIRISLVFYEYYYSYNRLYDSTNYTFTSTNKTIANLTRNFELVNAYYYVCFSSNSTVTNVSQYLAIVNNCILTRTCLRSNAACPGPSSVIIVPTSISSNSLIISFLWPNDLPYSPVSFTIQTTNTNQTGTPLSVTQNTTYTSRPYQLTGLQSQTTYTVNTSFAYTILNNVTKMNTTILTVTTSCSSTLFYTGVLSFISSSSLVVLFALFF